LNELANQKGDLSFLSFQTTSNISHHYLPTVRETNYLTAKCAIASAPITVSHLGTCFEVEIVKKRDASKILQKLNDWRNLRFVNGRFSGVEQLIEAAGRPENQNSPYVELAIVHDIRSIMLVDTYDEDLQTRGEQPIKICHRLQCCQIEENEFKRLFDETNAEFERIWLGDKPDNAGTNMAKSVRLRRRGRRMDNYINIYEASDM
jgi:hypothetical protein